MAIDGKSDNYRYTTVPLSAGNDNNNNDLRDNDVDDSGSMLQFPNARMPFGNGVGDTCPDTDQNGVADTYSLTGACISRNAGQWGTWTGVQEHRISGAADHQNFFPPGAIPTKHPPYDRAARLEGVSHRGCSVFSGTGDHTGTSAVSTTAQVGFGRIVALHHRSLGASTAETTMRP